VVAKPVPHVGDARFHLFDVVLTDGVVQQDVLIFYVIYKVAVVSR
jgi:hypothetical protein